MGIVAIVILVIYGIFKENRGSTVPIIGGADGPTSIFLATKVGNNYFQLRLVITILLVVLCGFVWYKRKK